MARLDFLGTLLPILSVYYVGISKDIGKKVTTAVMYKDENFFMMHVLLASELSWQRNDAIVFFYLPLYFSVFGRFFEIA